MIKLYVLTLILFLSVSLIEVGAQTRATTKPKAITTQTATTEDGKQVVLSSNGTWKYSSENDSNLSTRPKGGRPNSNLSFETGLVFKSGDVKPIARTTFYLIDDDLARILRAAGLHAPQEYGGGDSDEDLINAYARSIKYSILPAYKDFYPTAKTALQSHVIQQATTDFSGKAEFPAVPSGTYYLMGMSETPRGYAIWNLRVELKPGKNSVTLDQNNAVTAL